MSHAYLTELADIVSDLDDDGFFYLGGPVMQIYRTYNELVAMSYSVSTRLDWPSDTHDLNRALAVCSLPNCVGGIFLDGWHNYYDARAETFLLEALGKQLYLYDDKDGPRLELFERESMLRQLRMLDLMNRSAEHFGVREHPTDYPRGARAHPAGHVLGDR